MVHVPARNSIDSVCGPGEDLKRGELTHCHLPDDHTVSKMKTSAF